MLKEIFITVSILLFATCTARAGHLVGGEIYYECLGGDQYLITLKVYRDCLNSTTDFDVQATISVFNSFGGHVTDLFVPYNSTELLDVVITNPCLQAPPNLCIEEAIYTVTTSLPFISGGYHISYQRCCRNQSVSNIVNAGDQGSTYTTQLPEAALNGCNSSPYFNEFPPLALCVGDQLVFDHSATDSDGDQLVYSLCTPYHGGSDLIPAPSPADAPPYSQINWGGGYASAYPIDANPQLAIDPATGALTGVPSQIGLYVVGVCVEEYRNGQLLSTNNRDFQFNVVNCSSNVEAVIPGQVTFHDVCDGLEVEFDNSSVNGQYYHWDFGVDGVTNDTSNLENPTYVFPAPGTYFVTLIANPSYPCADTTIEEIAVYEIVVADILADGDPCFDVNSFDFEASGQFGTAATFAWEFENAQPLTSTQMNPQGIEFDSLGQSTVTLTITENVCSDQAQVDIMTYLRPNAYFHPEIFVGCNPVTISLIDSSFSGSGHEVLWNFGDSIESGNANPFHTYSTSGIYDLSLRIWTTQGCLDESEFVVPNAVVVHEIPTGIVSVEPDTQSIFDPTFQFQGASDEAVSCYLLPYPSDSLWNSIQNCEFQYIYPDTGDHFPVMFFVDENGCSYADTVMVRVEPEVRFWLPNAFTPNNDRLNDTWGAKAMGWKEFELRIFDRWGKLVYQTTDPNDWWNGRVNNESNLEPVIGVYSYHILARSVKHDYINESGHVSIVR